MTQGVFMVSDAQKKAVRKWQKENMTTLGCKVTKAKATKFKEACQKLGMRPNQIFIRAVDETIKKVEGLD